jgi:hypothetical protein
MASDGPGRGVGFSAKSTCPIAFITNVFIAYPVADEILS